MGRGHSILIWVEGRGRGALDGVLVRVPSAASTSECDYANPTPARSLPHRIRIVEGSLSEGEGSGPLDGGRACRERNGERFGGRREGNEGGNRTPWRGPRDSAPSGRAAIG